MLGGWLRRLGVPAYRFALQKRDTGDGNNGWGDVYATDSDNPAGTFGASEYSYTDFGTGPGAQCYRVLALPVTANSGFGDGVSDERCTVRPDGFPQSVPLSADQWDDFPASPFLPAINGAPADDFRNITRSDADGQELVNRSQHFGPDLDWASGGACWIFHGQGDPGTGGCAAKDSQPLQYVPPTGDSVLVVVTDPQRCGTDDPANNACVLESRTILGNPAGTIETTTVGLGTDRSPFAANGLK